MPVVAARHGIPSGPIAGPAWPGVMNDVCLVGEIGDRVVVRARRERSALEEFEREAWCAAAVRDLGVRTPRILAHGVVGDVAYSVQEAVEGDSGERHRSNALWRHLGRTARMIASVDLRAAPASLFTRFGRDPDAAWRAHLDYNLGELTRDDPLIGLGVYARSVLPALRHLVGSLGDRPIASGLVHGDLALRNLIVSGDGAPVLIDWGSASTGPVPHTDLVNLLRNRDGEAHPTDAEIDAFVAGFQERAVSGELGSGQLLGQARAARVLHGLDVARWAIDRAPDRLPDAVADARTVVAAYVAAG